MGSAWGSSGHLGRSSGDLIKEDDIKNVDNLKMKMISLFCLHSDLLDDALTNAAVWLFFN